jgi:acetoin utilization deacetylase AcuC-like enzyme
MRTVHDDRHRSHHGGGELSGGRFVPSVECPARADAVLAAIRDEALGHVAAATPHGLEPILRVHARDYVEFLCAAHAEWAAVHGAGEAFPLTWPERGADAPRPDAIDGKLGFYSTANDSPITAGTWAAACAAADTALTAADLVAGGERAAFALCRPPGHHAGRRSYGGYCYLANAAIAAQSLVDRGARVAIVDVDYHHGNGTQDVFFARADVLTVSIHADPRVDFPFFTGYAHERGSGAGEGANLNLPLPHGTDWRGYEPALREALATVERFGPDALVVSLGLDTYVDDPVGRFALTTADYRALGALLGGAGLPTVFVLEGGYDVEALGRNTVAVLGAFDGA